ncbi:MAG: hypothetical protein AAFQ40_10985 [Cyanobacteria bacterium J06623_5]
MTQANLQQILVGFPTEQALTEAQSTLQTNDLANTIQAGIVPPTSRAVPEQRAVKADTWKAAGLGGTIGAIAGAIIATVAQNTQNGVPIEDYATPISVLSVLVGIAFGAAGGGAASFFAGKPPERTAFDNYKLRVEASPQDIKTATQLLLDKGGHLL